MISINNLTKKYNSKLIYDNTNVFFDSKINFLMGENGSGKSTLLNILAGIKKPDSGTIFFKNEKISYSDGSYRVKIGFVLDIPHYPYHLTIREYIALLNSIYSIKKDKMQHEELINFFDLNDYLDYKLSNLSTGFLKRVKLFASMIHNPDTYIYDEPFSGLDKKFTHKLIHKIQELNNLNKGFIITSHSEVINMFNASLLEKYEIHEKKINRI